MTQQSFIDKAQGCLLGQLIGDSLGSLVEFKTSDQILQMHPNGVRDLMDGGTWNTVAGQPTDDSEMALLLARMLVKDNHYDAESAFKQYRYWLASRPFDCGLTIISALNGKPIIESQANGAMMRISPLGIFGVNFPLEQVKEWAVQDANLTHPNTVCKQANALYAMAIAQAIKHNLDAVSLYQTILDWAKEMDSEASLILTIENASHSLPENFSVNEGWVLTALQNALYQLLHAPNFEEGIIATVMNGGDTDTNAAICGALLGALYGTNEVPERWITPILNCQPESSNPKVKRPRPACFWPVDALTLAEKLVLN